METHLEAVRRLLPPAGDFGQCYAFSIHKAGSSLMHKMIGEVCHAAAIPAVTIPDILFREGLAEKDWEADPRMAEFFTRGRVYFGFRAMPSFLPAGDPELRNRPTVLLVRDPRDALVSQYFSLGGRFQSHRLPDKNKEQFIERTQKTAHLDIDEYVLQSSRNHLRKLQAYRQALNLRRILLRRYEDIYFDKRKFLGEIFDTFDLSVPAGVLDAVAARNDIRPEAEVLGKHIRKGAPGDHREKLKPETIATLNETFRGIAPAYGYDLDAG